MDLETLKLVAFALWAESNEGVSGKSPVAIWANSQLYQMRSSIEGLREQLGEDLMFTFDNYLTVWEAAEEPEAPTPGKEPIELQELTLLPKKEAPALEEQQGSEPVEAPERATEQVDDGELLPEERARIGKPMPVEESPQPKKQRGKRGRLLRDLQPQTRRADLSIMPCGITGTDGRLCPVASTPLQHRLRAFKAPGKGGEKPNR